MFQIGVTTTDFKDRFNQYFTCLPMGIYYVNFLVNPTKKRVKRSDAIYYTEIEKYIIKQLEKVAQKVVSRTGVTGSSEWWYTDTETIEIVFQQAEKKYGGQSIPYDLQSAFAHNEPKHNESYFTGVIKYY